MSLLNKINVKIRVYIYSFYFYFRSILLKNVYVDFSSNKFENLGHNEKIITIYNSVLDIIRERTVSKGTRILLSGMLSSHNKNIDSIESMARIMPFLASILYRDDVIEIQKDEISIYLRRALLNIPKVDKWYSWGRPKDYDQRIAEMADFALSLWLTKDSIWSYFDDKEKIHILDWLSTVSNKVYSDNNWHLFTLLIEEIIDALSGTEKTNVSRYHRILSFLNSDCWFQDGSDGDFDYYNAWAFYYSFYWLSIINPHRYREKYISSLTVFSQQYKYLIGSDGFPFFGRSACYKYSVTCPLLLAGIEPSISLSKEFAITRFEDIWNTYSKFEVNVNNLLNQGLFDSQARFFDSYSGPGSSLWSLRSSILINFNYHLYKNVTRSPSFSNKEFSVNINDGKFLVTHCLSEGTSLIRNDIINEKQGPIPKVSALNLFMGFVFQRPFRGNYKKIFGRYRKYTSDNYPLK
ncbi:conserved hypothetical protein [Vibrio chagasii]|nr:conserved hypothetical protein [Vibrio chagasii]CAH6867784.1 conserved hypothetical protein [Vibrio chagasii]CAH7051701.1 conserved hypothetical protein [Vibrio chagasii]CAH7112829.1 conserved hypothetical protein [Vibrio chagasii]CAH7303042.1 conserved hypothetical protein [Vibrio chagasii]